MHLRTIIVGIAVTAILVVVLGVTRLMSVDLQEEIIELEVIEPIVLAAPEEPVDPPEEVEQDVTPPPPPAFEDLSASLDIDIPAIPHSEASFDPEMPVEMFSTDVAPAELPVAQVPAKPVAKPTNPSPPKIAKIQPREKSSYSISDLDTRPTMIRKGRFRWPSGTSDRTVTAKVLMELDEQGRCRVVEISSISNKNFESAVRSVVSGSRFTPPKVNGKAVKVSYYWPLTLNKP